MSILSDLKSLFLPPVCPVCGGPLAEGDGAFCMVCRTTVPRTMFWLKAENPMAARLRDFFPVVQASAFIWFIQGSPWQRVIHDFKYRSRWRTAYELGRWFGSNLARSGLYAGVDCVVPVPLHVRRLLGRGYNQADYAAEGIAEGLGVPVVHRALRRLRNNPSQTTRSTAERWVNVEGLFTVRRSDLLAGKHILLVDDVVTTGSTLLACAEALAAALPECRISMAALAVSYHHFGFDR
ncbi:ComF family protein [uncultured Alistipes sp.]|uniref:ComF family protein n=1 Tax=uncultured Alistipes sp. TaxID=538949 RepID=UPI0026159257|nr:phosphoribosyltransferase family protein [uncultured Alistipes sp.]